MALLALAAAWMAGTGVALALPLSGSRDVFLILSVAAGVAGVLAWPWPRLRLLALMLACLYLAAGHTSAALERLMDDPLATLQGEVALLGIVDAPPERRGIRTTLTLDVQARLEQGVWHPQRGRLWFQVSGGPPLTYGDAVLARGRLSQPSDRPGYPLTALLRRQGISHVLERPQVSLVERRQGDPLWTLVSGWRTEIVAALRRSLPEPHASLLAGVLVGARADLPADLRQALTATGTSHIVAVSGFNVAIVAGLVSLVLGRTMGRRFALVPAIGLVALYTLLTGPQPSAVRAAIMGCAALVALSTGRLADPLTSLAGAGAAMLAVDPLQGLDLGFQLSFAATAGLILLHPLLASRLAWLPRPVREPLTVTLAAQLATLPLLATTFQTVSLVAPLVNLAIAPALPAVMVLGGLLLAASPLPPLAALVAWLAWAALSYVEQAIRLAASWPGAIVPLGSLPSWLAVGLYAAVALLCLAGLPEARALAARLAPPRRFVAFAAALAVAFAVTTAAAAARPDGQLRVQTLDLGTSLGLLVRSPGGRLAVVLASEPSASLATSLAQRLGPLANQPALLALPSEAAAAQVNQLPAYARAGLIVVPAAEGGQDQPGGLDRLALRAGAWLELDRDLQLGLVLATEPPGRRLGWWLRYGLLDLVLANGASGWPALASSPDVLVLATMPLGAPLQSGPLPGPLLLVAPEQVLDLPLDRAPAGLVLSAAVHHDLGLSSDGRFLRVGSTSCGPPLEPPPCAAEAALAE